MGNDHSFRHPKTQKLVLNSLPYTYRHISHSPRETKALGLSLKPYLKPGSILALIGDLGSGKTTFVQGILAAFQVNEPAASPTFTYANEYETSEALLVHMDAYRLNSPGELFTLGYADYLEQGAIILIEWADRVESVWSDAAWRIRFQQQLDDPLMRIITFTLPFSIHEWQQHLLDSTASGRSQPQPIPRKT